MADTGAPLNLTLLETGQASKELVVNTNFQTINDNIGASTGDAKADGSTKGVAAFTAADFNDNGSGLISLDYTNGQAADASHKGYLTSADWSTFNGKQGALTNSAGLRAALSDETGTGLAVFNDTPSLTSPAISGSPSITGLSSPTNPSDAATKAYVDALLAGLSPKSACRMATTAALTATYSNGLSGVGATLTNAGTLAALTVDGVSAQSGDRLLVKNQATAAQNGIYTVTTVGSGAVAWVLTRATDYDSSSEVAEGTYTLLEEGTLSTGTLWMETGAGPFTIGTTAITFLQLSVAAQTVTLTGDVTGSGAGSITTTIATDAVTYAKMQNISATSRILGRKTAGSGDTEECTLSDVLDFIGSATQGDLLYRGASTWTRLAAGTSGQFLQTQGAAANPQWGTAVDLTTAQTLTNKRVTRRVVTLTDAATVTPNADTTDEGIVTTLSQATLLANPSGTPTDGQLLMLRIKSSTSRALTYGSEYRGSTDLALPTATTGGDKTDYLGFVRNAADTKWDLLAKNFGY